jgi:integrase
MHMLQEGVDLIKIRDLLGHESISTTEIYATTHDADLRTAMKTPSAVISSSLASWHNNPGIMERIASYSKKRT